MFFGGRSMVKLEKRFAECETTDIVIGEPVILRLENGDRIRTSPVQNYAIDAWGGIVIMTLHTIYRKHH